MSQTASTMDKKFDNGAIGFPMTDQGLADVLPERMFRFIMHHAAELGRGFAQATGSLGNNPDLSDPNLTNEDRQAIMDAIKSWSNTDRSIVATSYVAGYIAGIYEGFAWNSITTALNGSMWEDSVDYPDDNESDFEAVDGEQENTKSPHED